MFCLPSNAVQIPKMTENGVLYLPAKYSKIAKRRNFGVTKIIDFGSCATVYNHEKSQQVEGFKSKVLDKSGEMRNLSK